MPGRHETGASIGRTEKEPSAATGSSRGDLRPEELMARLGSRTPHKGALREITASRLAADEAPRLERGGGWHIDSLEREGAGLKERIKDLERRFGTAGAAGGLRAAECAPRARARTKEGEISHRDHLLERRRSRWSRRSADRGAGLAQGSRAPGRPPPRRWIGEGPGREGG